MINERALARNAAAIGLALGAFVFCSSTPTEADVGDSAHLEATAEPLCPDFAEAAPPGAGAVTTTSVAGNTADVASSPLSEQQRLEPMLGIVVAYGGDHADTFSGYGLAWLGPEDASVFAAFTDNLDEHRANLAELVPFPDELVVCRGALSEREVRSLQAELSTRYAGRFSSMGNGGTGRLSLRLLSNEEDLAAEFHERYGEQLELSVGLFPYPMPDPLPPANCEPLPQASATAPVHARVERTEQISLRAGEPVSAEIVLTNTIDESVRLEFGAAPPALLFRGGESTSVNAYEFAVPAILQFLDIPPGGSERLTVGIGIASCDPSLGYQVPPGDYQLVVAVDDVVTDPYAVTVNAD